MHFDEPPESHHDGIDELFDTVLRSMEIVDDLTSRERAQLLEQMGHDSATIQKHFPIDESMSAEEEKAEMNKLDNYRTKDGEFDQFEAKLANASAEETAESQRRAREFFEKLERVDPQKEALYQAMVDIGLKVAMRETGRSQPYARDQLLEQLLRTLELYSGKRPDSPTARGR